jgi:hypothetical protein
MEVLNVLRMAPATMTEKMMGQGRAPSLRAIYEEVASRNKVKPTAIANARIVNPLSPCSSGIMRSPHPGSTIDYINVM